MILFLHGFGSCGWGQKSLALRRHFGVARVLAPDLPFQPQAALERIHRLIHDHRVEAMVGSSLGGFLATCANATSPLPSVLINPVVRPQELLARYRGPQRRWCDGMPFEVGDSYLAQLAAMHREKPDARERYLVLLQEGDEVLDHRRAAAYYTDKDLVQLPGGSHRFDDFERQLPRIADWLGAQ